MCGFAGIFGGISRDKEQLMGKMISLVQHRGPDAINIKINEDSVLAHARLKIQDLSNDANQPFVSESGNFEIIFNGEIYNFLEIREKLRGVYNFKTKSDTEVLVAAWQHWGENCLQHLKGMFAFCVFDKRTKIVTLVRDRFGQKPLYFSQPDGILVVASEIKVILCYGVVASAEPKVWSRYLLTGKYDDTRDTYFRNIKQVMPGEILKFSNGDLISRKYYYSLAENISSQVFANIDEASECVRETMTRVCDMHMRSDVPVGVMLSGGLDSASMLASLHLKNHTGKNLSSFSVDFGEALSERVWIEAAADAYSVQSEITTFDITAFFQSIKPMMWHLEGPIGGLMNCALIPVMEAAKNSGVKVLLDGTGPDEAFGGYRNHHNLFIATLLKKGDPTSSRHIQNYARVWGVPVNIVESLALKEFDNLKMNTAIDGTLSTQLECMKLHPDDIAISESDKMESTGDLLKDALVDYISGSKIFRNTRFIDRLSMAYGIEIRFPFLEHDFIELGVSLPNEWYFLDGYTKGIIRHAFKGQMPDEVRLAKKRSIQAPQGEWLRSAPFREYIWDMLNSTKFAQRGYFDINKCKEKYQSFLDGNFDNSFFVWQWINLEEWHSVFEDTNSVSDRHYLNNANFFY